jgi:hypothetical protein
VAGGAAADAPHLQTPQGSAGRTPSYSHRSCFPVMPPIRYEVRSHFILSILQT